MIDWSGNHIPLLYLGLTVETAYVGYKSDVGSIHLQIQIIGKSDFFQYKNILLMILGAGTVNGNADIAILVTYSDEIWGFIQEVYFFRDKSLDFCLF